MSNLQDPDPNCPSTNKRARMENVFSPLALRQQLYDMFKEGIGTDVELLVTTHNDEVKGLKAHKNILVAMSPVIATKTTRRWEEGGKEEDVIDIPLDVGVAAVEKFLEFLYTENIDEDLNIELWLELLFLSDHYQVQDLMDLCDVKLIGKLDTENCINIYEKSKLFQTAKCGAIAFFYLQKNFGEMLSSNPNLWMQLDACIRKLILESNYLPNVEEIDLFKCLKRWKDENVEERASDFQQLLKLIRFPLIGMENFAEFVVPSRELDLELMLQMFVHFAGKGKVPEPFKSSPRNLLEPKDSEELQIFINESQSGDIIELDGTYFSFMILENTTNLTIKAKPGKEAVINCDFVGIEIYGKSCKLEDLSVIFRSDFINTQDTQAIHLKLTADHNILKNLTISGGFTGLKIDGNENSIQNVSIIDPKKVGCLIGMNSAKTQASNVSVLFNEKAENSIGFYIHGRGGHKLSNLVAKNVDGNRIRSRLNVINGFQILGTGLGTGLALRAARDNHLENVVITGNNSTLNSDFECANLSLKNCQVDKMYIEGKFHKFEGCKANEIGVWGEGHHTFNNCEVGLVKLEIETRVESTGCVYQSVERVQEFEEGLAIDYL